LVGSAILLILGPVIALLSNTGENARSTVVESLLNDQNFGFLAYQILAPIIVAIAIFSYLDSSGRVAVVHSMPVTRNALFRSSVTSGLILLFVPHLVLTVVMIPFVRLGFSGFTQGDRGVGVLASAQSSALGVQAAGQDTTLTELRHDPDVGDLLRWFILTSMIILFVYSLSVLAGILSGNVGVAALVSVLLNAIVPVLYVLSVFVLVKFLYGFSYSSLSGLIWMHPVLNLWMNGSHLSLWPMLVFLAVSLMVLYGSAVLYRHFESEHAGNHITFDGFNLIATVLTTFVGACLAGMLMESLTQGYELVRPHHGLFFLGVVLGAPVVFAVTSMTLCGTVRIFNMSGLKRFGAFALVTAIFFSLTAFDVTGFERRLPDQRSIAAVTIPSIALTALPYAGSNADAITLSDSQSIADARALHEEIVSRSQDSRYDSLFTNSDADASATQSSSDNCQGCSTADDSVLTVEFHYRMDSGSSMDRSYTLYQKYLRESDAYRRLVNDAGYRQANSLQRLGYNNILSSQVSDVYGDSIYSASPTNLTGPETSLGAADARTLAKLLDEDYRSLPNTDVASTIFHFDSQTGNPINKKMRIGVSFQMKDHDGNSNGSVFYGITDEYTRTMRWLKDKGLYETMVSATTKLMNAVS
jgi:hypothetical protein